MESVWPDSVVEDNNLDYCISQLRKLLHPSKYIETVPRHGYRFVAEVTFPRSQARLIRLEPPVHPSDAPHQQIEFFTTSDGARIAYNVAGQGPALVRTTHWLNHLDFEWKTPLRTLCGSRGTPWRLLLVMRPKHLNATRQLRGTRVLNSDEDGLA
jgi:hypothetical protein